MINKRIKSFIKDIKNHKIFYSIYFSIIILVLLGTFITLDYEVLSPGSLIDLSDRIEIDNGYESKGSFNLTYVTSRNGSLINILLSYIIPSWDKSSLDDIRLENENKKEVFKRNQIFLKQTSYDAIIAAFEEANLPYNIKSIDLYVAYVFESSNTNLKVGDIIKEINNIKVNSLEDISNEVSKYKENDKINIKVLRDNKLVDCYSKLIIEDNRLIIGLYIAELKDVDTNPKVKYIFENDESGSSRGLLCALEIYDKITEYDLTKGRKISGTGTMDDAGIVGAIDGVEYKLKGAVKKGAQIFIVPTDNYLEALAVKQKYNYDIQIIEADTLHNVIEKLKK